MTLLCVVCSTNRMCNTSMMSWVCFLGILGSGCPGVDLSHLGDNPQNTLCTAVSIAESCLEFNGKICLLKSPKLMQIGLFRIYHSASSYTAKQWHRSNIVCERNAAASMIEYPVCCLTVWAQRHCRVSPSHFLAECCERWLNQDSFILLCFVLFALLSCM